MNIYDWTSVSHDVIEAQLLYSVFWLVWLWSVTAVQLKSQKNHPTNNVLAFTPSNHRHLFIYKHGSWPKKKGIPNIFFSFLNLLVDLWRFLSLSLSAEFIVFHEWPSAYGWNSKDNKRRKDLKILRSLLSPASLYSVLTTVFGRVMKPYITNHRGVCCAAAVAPICSHHGPSFITWWVCAVCTTLFPPLTGVCTTERWRSGGGGADIFH